MTQAPSFAVVSGEQVHTALHGKEKQVTAMVEAAYRLHGQGLTVNPDSYFLRFPDQPANRIIALPASVKGEVNVHGIKWISSFPSNVAAGIPRASAALILNDTETGYPFACLESSIISATRTAASAALAAVTLAGERGVAPKKVGFIGVGLIARFLHTYLVGNGLSFDESGIFDLNREHAEGFKGYLDRTETQVTIHDSAESLITSSDLIVLATVAGEPHILDPKLLAHNPLVLHVSLRDLSPEIILDAYNIVDDVDHCLKAGTSPHLAEQQTGNRDFVDGTLYDVLIGKTTPPADQPVIFSPFGLGVLDLAVAKYVYDEVKNAGTLHEVPNFFYEMKRYG